LVRSALLEAARKGVAVEAVHLHILTAPGVVDFHDLHAWTITSGVNIVGACRSGQRCGRTLRESGPGFPLACFPASGSLLRRPACDLQPAAGAKESRAGRRPPAVPFCYSSRRYSNRRCSTA
jgi:hypothetical protein